MALAFKMIRRPSALKAIIKPVESGILFCGRSFTGSSTVSFPAAASSSPSSTSTGDYISPFADFFSSIEKGQTTLNVSTNKTLGADELYVLKCGIPEDVIRFRTTSYPRLMLPPYTHNSEYKVTLKISLKHIPLETPLEKKIFFQIVESRYLADKKELRLTSEKFASRIENKRYLCSMLDRIVLGAKRLAQEIEKGEVPTSS